MIQTIWIGVPPKSYQPPPQPTPGAQAAMRLALSVLHFINDNGYRLEEYEQGRMDAAIAALEQEMS